jgi:5'-3' exonuclease
VSGPLLILDSATLYYRAFYALPEKMTAPDGSPHNAVRGFLSMLTKLITIHHPSGIVAAWDNDWRPAWRVELMPSYKTHRVGTTSQGEEEVPDTLSPQIDAIAAILDAWGIARIGIDGFEADDVIASVASQHQGRSFVVTSDRDLIQVVTDQVSLLLQVTGGVEGWSLLDPAAIESKYGVSPTDYLAMAALRGDPSDGLPGITGIGDKTACALVSAFDNLETLVSASASSVCEKPLTPRLAQRITAGADYLEAALAVITAETRLPVSAWKFEVPYEPVAGHALNDLGVRWGVEKYVEELLQAALG